MRVFEDAYVEAVPEPEREPRGARPAGLSLSAQGTNDAQSYRLAILYESGETSEEAVARRASGRPGSISGWRRCLFADLAERVLLVHDAERPDGGAAKARPAATTIAIRKA